MLECHHDSTGVSGRAGEKRGWRYYFTVQDYMLWVRGLHWKEGVVFCLDLGPWYCINAPASLGLFIAGFAIYEIFTLRPGSVSTPRATEGWKLRILWRNPGLRRGLLWILWGHQQLQNSTCHWFGTKRSSRKERVPMAGPSAKTDLLCSSVTSRQYGYISHTHTSRHHVYLASTTPHAKQYTRSLCSPKDVFFPGGQESSEEYCRVIRKM